MHTWLRISCLAAALLSFSCRELPDNPMKPGAYYSVIHDEYSFTVAKVIAMDDKGFFVQFYTNTYDVRPASINEAELTLHSLRGKSHLRFRAMPRREFYALVPIYIQDGRLSDEELLFFSRWKRYTGGRWEHE